MTPLRPDANPGDGSVINTAMATLLDDDWAGPIDKSQSWCVVLDSKWSPSERPTFESAIERVIVEVEVKDIFSPEDESGKADRIRAVLDSVDTDGQSYVPPTLEPLSHLRLIDDLVVVDAEASFFDYKPGDDFGDSGGGRTVLTSGQLAPPSYSLDGRYAVIELEMSPFRHSRNTSWILERTYNEWRVIFVHDYVQTS
jgi:hypothetical protein